MYELHAIEAINVDQLVTATDRLLLRATRCRRLQTRRSFDLSREAALAVAASKARKSQQHAAVVDPERTVHVRNNGWKMRRELVGAAAVLAGSAWLSVLLACLLP